MAVVLLLIGAYVSYLTIDVGITMIRMLFEGGWLGPEPELLYLVAGLLMAALFIGLGVRMWSR
jgi:hypothetical protein